VPIVLLLQRIPAVLNLLVLVIRSSCDESVRPLYFVHADFYLFMYSQHFLQRRSTDILKTFHLALNVTETLLRLHV